MGESLLSRVQASASADTPLTSLQAKVDSAVLVSKKELLDPYQLIAMVIGMAAYSAVRYGSLSRADRIVQSAGRFERMAVKPGLIARTYPIPGSQGKAFLMGPLEIMAAREEAALRAKVIMLHNTASSMTLRSFPLGVVAGASTYEISHRALLSLAGKGPENPDLWRWSGREGIQSGLIRSAFVFGGALLAGDIAGHGGFALMESHDTMLRPAVTGLFAVSGFTGTYWGLDKFVDWITE